MKKYVISILFVFSMIRGGMYCHVDEVHALRKSDVDNPSANNIMVKIPGTFEKPDVKEVLNLINSYRKEACEKGYIKPGTDVRLTMNDYKPIKWSTNLEWIAQTRAAEAAVCQSHERPNGESWFTVEHNSTSSCRETLAWNYSGLIYGIKQWYGEKEDWVKQNTDAVTGHYESMIDPDVSSIGVGAFASKSDNWTCVAGEYSYEDDEDSSCYGVYGNEEQLMEVPASSLHLSVSGPSSLNVNETKNYHLNSYVSLKNTWGEFVDTPLVSNGVKWESSNTSVADIDQNGKLIPHRKGTTIIKAYAYGGKYCSKKITVNAPRIGTLFAQGGVQYRITKNNEVSFHKLLSSPSSMVINNQVNYYNEWYKVTTIDDNACLNKKTLKTLKLSNNIRSIGSRAFKNCVNLSGVTISKNVNRINKEAFYNCKKMVSLKILSMYLNKKNVGANAFKKTKIKKVNVPKKKKKAYKALLRSRGVSRKAKYK